MCSWGSGCALPWPLRPSRQLSRPSLGAPAAAWLWHAGLVPSLGQARPGSPERQRNEVAIRCCVLRYSHAFWGFLIIVTRKPLPPTLWSLPGCLTSMVSPGSTRPLEQLHWPAMRPAPFGGAFSAPSAPRGWTPCRTGALFTFNFTIFTIMRLSLQILQ